MELIYDLSTGLYPILGYGGTKTTYGINKSIVVFEPNTTDGQGLINIWNRIIADEIQMSLFLQKIGILTLTFNICKIKNKNQKVIQTISAQSFESEINNGIYIIDTKNSRSSTWPKDGSLSLFTPNLDPYDINNWLDIMKPYILDIKNLVKNNICLSGDSLNLAFVKKGSTAHSSSDLLFEVRLFAFDFANKHYALDIKNMKPSTYFINNALSRGAEYAVWEELCPHSVVLEEKEHSLYKNLCTRMIEMYNNI